MSGEGGGLVGYLRNAFSQTSISALHQLSIEDFTPNLPKSSDLPSALSPRGRGGGGLELVAGRLGGGGSGGVAGAGGGKGGGMGGGSGQRENVEASSWDNGLMGEVGGFVNVTLEVEEDPDIVAGSLARSSIFRSKMSEDIAAALEIAPSRVAILRLYRRSIKSTDARQQGTGWTKEWGEWEMIGLDKQRENGERNAIVDEENCIVRRGVLVDLVLLDPVASGGGNSTPRNTGGGGGDDGGRGDVTSRSDLKTTRELAFVLEKISRNKGCAARGLPSLARLTSVLVHANPLDTMLRLSHFCDRAVGEIEAYASHMHLLQQRLCQTQEEGRREQACLETRAQALLQVCVFVFIYMYIYARTRARARTHTHTHTNTYT